MVTYLDTILKVSWFTAKVTFTCFFFYLFIWSFHLFSMLVSDNNSATFNVAVVEERAYE